MTKNTKLSDTEIKELVRIEEEKRLKQKEEDKKLKQYGYAKKYDEKWAHITVRVSNEKKEKLAEVIHKSEKYKSINDFLNQKIDNLLNEND